MGAARLALAMVGAVVLLTGCASTLASRKPVDEARASIESVLRQQGYEAITSAVTGGDWTVNAELHRSYPYVEKTYRIIQEPSLRIGPGGNNVTVFDEKVDHSQFATAEKVQSLTFRARVTLPAAGTASRIAVRVSGPEALRGDKYRDITWMGDEPPSPRQLEEALVKALRQALAD